MENLGFREADAATKQVPKGWFWFWYFYNERINISRNTTNCRLHDLAFKYKLYPVNKNQMGNGILEISSPILIQQSTKSMTAISVFFSRITQRSSLTHVFKCFAELNQKRRVVVWERNVPPMHGTLLTEHSCPLRSTELQIQHLLKAGEMGRYIWKLLLTSSPAPETSPGLPFAV